MVTGTHLSKWSFPEFRSYKLVSQVRADSHRDTPSTVTVTVTSLCTLHSVFMCAFSTTAFLLLWERNPGVTDEQIIQTQSDDILLWTLEFYFVSLYTLWMTFIMNLFKSVSSAPGIGNIRNHSKAASLKTVNINYLYQLSQSLNTFLKKKKKTLFPP